MPSARGQWHAPLGRTRWVAAVSSGVPANGTGRVTTLGALLLVASTMGCLNKPPTTVQGSGAGVERSGRPRNDRQREPVYGIGENVTAPVLVFNPRPPYTDDARRLEIEGEVVIQLVVSTHGEPLEVQEISKPLGYGLDESALRAVRTWRFRPGKKNGLPVAVRLKIEVGFQPD